MRNLRIIWVFALTWLCSCAQNAAKHKIDPTAKAFNEQAMKLLYSSNDNTDSMVKAIALLDSATKIDSNYYLAYYNKLVFLNTLKQFDKAVLAVNNLIRIRPTAHDLYLSRGTLYFRLGNMTASKPDFEQSLALCNKVLDTMDSKNINYDYISLSKAISLIMLDRQAEGQHLLKEIYNRQTDSNWKKYYGSFLNKNPIELIELFESGDGEDISYPVKQK